MARAAVARTLAWPTERVVHDAPCAIDARGLTPLLTRVAGGHVAPPALAGAS